MVDTPYYAFLCTRQEQECRSGKWIAINKNLPHPVVNNIDISSRAEITDLRPFNTSVSTWLKVYYKDGSVRDFKFDNTHWNIPEMANSAAERQFIKRGRQMRVP